MALDLTTILDLTQLRLPATDAARTYEAELFEGRPGSYRVVSPVDLRFRIYKDRDRYRLVGRVSATLALACSRCLEWFEAPGDAEFDVRYLPHSCNIGLEEAEVADEDLSVAFYRDERIDLLQLMEEQFDLGLPMKPLCDAECRGLCASCGTNLNEGSCSCEVRWEDPRLAPLKTLMKRDEHDA